MMINPALKTLKNDVSYLVRPEFALKLREIHRLKMLADGRLKDGLRLCSICVIYKTFDKFYLNDRGLPNGGYCKACQHEMYVQRKEQGENYKIECSYCGTPISRAPFCDEDCRKKFEKAINE